MNDKKDNKSKLTSYTSQSKVVKYHDGPRPNLGFSKVTRTYSITYYTSIKSISLGPRFVLIPPHTY